jgi:hypothetical protein
MDTSIKCILLILNSRAKAFTFPIKNDINIHEVNNMDMQKLKQEIGKMTDPRRSYGNLRHKLEDMIIIGLLCILCKGEDYNDMEVFGKHREEWLLTFLELPNGIPDSDTFRRLFERLDPKELSKHLRTPL